MTELRSDRLADVGEAGFGLSDWIVRPGLNQLSRGAQVVHLRPKVMDVLVFLADRAGKVVPKSELTDAVWAKEFLADTALTRAVFELREALGDDPRRPAYVETIPKRGYRLIAEVSRARRTAAPDPAPRPACAGPAAPPPSVGPG